ncbi:MAG TPA: hypothetical protein VJ489_03510 [Thermoplasmata archaeon]|nr:hypothetical protein [Thermoplasmata archaeon]
MVEWTKERVAWVVSGASFLSLVAIVVVALSGGIAVTQMFFGAVAILLIVWLCAMIASVSFSEEGWEVKGTSSEWAIAFLLNPVLAVLMYVTTGRQVEEAGIDVDDHERMARL